MLHCATRMNFLSYLYQQRQEIVYSLGLIDELPIAVCHYDYNSDKNLTIITQDDDVSGLPATLFQAREIVLFFHSFSYELNPRMELLTASYTTQIADKNYTPPVVEIVHPPA